MAIAMCPARSAVVVPPPPDAHVPPARPTAGSDTAGTDDAASPYASFWQAGFEGSDHVNGRAFALCLNTLTAHERHARGDYLRAGAFGMRTVRESAGWRRIDRDGRYGFEPITRRARHARELGVQVAWTAWHYGVPPGVDLFDDALVDRFASYCRALALHLRPFHERHAPIYTPVNEPSFLSWAACETGLMHPHRGDRLHEGYALKRRLVRAALAGMQAIRDVQPDARFLHVDPLVHVATPAGRDDLAEAARIEHGFQYQAWDMLAGRLEPQLGGSPACLDLVGVNYYHSSQWEHSTRAPLHWHLGDARRRRFRDMLAEVWARYARPLTVSETSHVGVGRARWITEVASEVRAARAGGIPVHGVCLYPAVDRPDWEDPQRWHNSGLWDVHAHGRFRRVLHRPSARALRRAQRAHARSPGHSPDHSPDPRDRQP